MRVATHARVGLILVVVLLLVPQGATYFRSGNRISIILGSLLWAFNYTTNVGIMVRIVSYFDLLYSFLLFGLGFVFIFQVVQYCQEKAGRGSAVALGIVSMCPMVFLVTVPNLIFRSPVIGFPLPILLAVGLLAMRYAGPKEPTTPWEGLDSDSTDQP